MKVAKKRKAVAGQHTKPEYPLSEAVQLVKTTSTAKFDETIDAIVTIDLGDSQSFRGTLSLPHSFGKEKRVLVFARGETAAAAKAAGADVVGDDDLVEKVKGGFLEFDVAVSTLEMMKTVGKLGQVLGRRGLMPSPKNGTVTDDVGTAVKEFKKGKVEYRANKEGVVQVPIGKVSLTPEQVGENFKALYSVISHDKPQGVKGEFIKNAYLSSTMGFGFKLNRKEI